MLDPAYICLICSQSNKNFSQTKISILCHCTKQRIKWQHKTLTFIGCGSSSRPTKLTGQGDALAWGFCAHQNDSSVLLKFGNYPAQALLQFEAFIKQCFRFSRGLQGVWLSWWAIRVKEIPPLQRQQTSEIFLRPSNVVMW